MQYDRAFGWNLFKIIVQASFGAKFRRIDCFFIVDQITMKSIFVVMTGDLTAEFMRLIIRKEKLRIFFSIKVSLSQLIGEAEILRKGHVVLFSNEESFCLLLHPGCDFGRSRPRFAPSPGIAVPQLC